MLARVRQRCPYGKLSVRQWALSSKRMVGHTSSIQCSTTLRAAPVLGDGSVEGDYNEDFFDENSRHQRI
jgi:hypothetical protein